MQGRLVVIAAVYPMLDGSDTAQSPFGTVRGGVIHIFALDTLLRAAYPVRAPGWAPLLLTVIAFVLVFAGWRRSVITGVVWTGVLLFVYIVAAFALFSLTRFLLPVAWPVGGGLLAAALGFLTFRRRPTQSECRAE